MKRVSVSRPTMLLHCFLNRKPCPSHDVLDLFSSCNGDLKRFDHFYCGLRDVNVTMETI